MTARARVIAGIVVLAAVLAVVVVLVARAGDGPSGREAGLAAEGRVDATGGGSASVAAGSDGDTRKVTLVDPDGDGRLARGPGEALRDRTDLGPVRPEEGVLTRLAQITDAHVRDEESPALIGFLDRLGGPFTSTFRPQETLTTQVLTAAVRSVDAARPDAVVVTGDLIDNDQENELDMALAALDGGTVRPDSVARGYDGPQLASDADPSYYRPGVDPPQYPGLLTSAQRAFRSPGLKAPWWAVAGNHDLLVSGEIATTPRLDAVATGDRALVEPPKDLKIPHDESGLLNGVDRLLANGLPGKTRKVPADPDRRELPAAQVVKRLRADGHGKGDTERLNYTIDLGSHVRGIVLDTVHRDRGSGGVITDATLAFLRAQLAAAGDRWVLVFTHQPLRTATAGGAVRALLDSDPHVLATIAGHTHRNRITARRTKAGGYWQITTASLADFPQQARMLQIRRTAGGGAVIETWMLDTASARLPDIARALAFLDAQGGRPDDARGRRLDRNVRLFRAAPRGGG